MFACHSEVSNGLILKQWYNCPQKVDLNFEDNYIAPQVLRYYTLQGYISKTGRWKTEEKIWVVVLVSKGCCNKFSQTSWLKTTEIHSLTVLEFRNLKSVSLSPTQGLYYLQRLWEKSDSCLFQSLVATGFLGLWPH